MYVHIFGSTQDGARAGEDGAALATAKVRRKMAAEARAVARGE